MTEQWQELKETIIEMRDNDGTGTQKEVCKFLANLMEILEKQMTNGWIPVSERLPKDKGLYLVSVKNDHDRRYSKTCWYYGEGNWFARQDVEAWMPLPEPYAESEEV